ncbi:hypothetical protein FOXG_20379 [Fusarium oxysporum f. sp. lycopersici 4287]|uniref:Uncharacterized protein n=1 Tax=Fusarium oxysporum f. sp. lycopersici (strain 4287 / CBS 123668 / FGSC 9935 / NRRL 34936) TaxID=426428 RepID=A0A0J9VIS5_FUSO4|nr:hypothetical protein FOXG_20379 [Fusarium oxysporum f. sp. lycopersici 4287]KAJ9422763.1 hypothetical protein QL093DRAFT_2099805 [Fusarium oxysporum]KNB10676.1 hypothetical protein FOXG_20379 [Fusarium oxysporum f. sp. lycopersici 4287]
MGPVLSFITFELLFLQHDSNTQKRLEDISQSFAPIMTGINIEPRISSAVPGPEAPHDAYNLESKFAPPTRNSLRKASIPISKLDGFISHLNRLIHTRDGHDSVVLFLACATQLAVSVLETPTPEAVQKVSIKLGQSIPRTFSSIISSVLSTPTLASLLSTKPAYKLLLVERLRALLGVLNDWHTMSRLWGLITMWMLTKKFITSSTDLELDKKEETMSPHIQKAKRTIAVTQIVSLTGFFVFDNAILLSMRGVLKWSKKPQSKFQGWCARCWCMYLCAELGRLYHARIPELHNGEKEDVRSRSEWKKKVFQVSAWLPLSIHYVAHNALLPEPIAALLATYAEFITVKGLWEATAEAI